MINTCQDTNDPTITYLRQLFAERFWGAVTIKLENGAPVHIRKEESLLPGKLTGKFRKEFPQPLG